MRRPTSRPCRTAVRSRSPSSSRSPSPPSTVRSGLTGPRAAGTATSVASAPALTPSAGAGGASPTGAVAPPATTVVTELLQRRARAILARDRDAWLSTADHAVPGLAAAQGALFDRLATVQPSSWNYALLSPPRAHRVRGEVRTGDRRARGAWAGGGGDRLARPGPVGPAPAGRDAGPRPRFGDYQLDVIALIALVEDAGVAGAAVSGGALDGRVIAPAGADRATELLTPRSFRRRCGVCTSLRPRYRPAADLAVAGPFDFGDRRCRARPVAALRRWPAFAGNVLTSDPDLFHWCMAQLTGTPI